MSYKKSWKTTLGGTLTSTGVVLIGAVAMNWMPEKLRMFFGITGFVMTALGTLAIGFFGRDNDVSSEEVKSIVEKKQE